ncbi:MAG: hypothetical protein OXH76_12885 [Boseongicola sp.]|nr:hypothetical protein [Boseongicola sp.]
MHVSRFRFSQVLPVILFALTALLLEPPTGHAAESAEQAGLRIGATNYHRRRGEPPLPTVVLLVLALIVAVTRFGGM